MNRKWVAAFDNLATIDGGVTWAPKTSNVTSNLWSVRMVNDSTGWIVGDNGLILKTTNYGATWSPQNSNISTVLWSIATDDCFPGEAFASGNGGVILHTTDGGITWAPQVSGTGVFLHWISFDNPMCYGFVVGQNGTIRATTDFGSTWLANTSNSTHDLRSVFMTAPLDLFGWAVGDGGEILSLTWPLGVAENELPAFTISPNPSNGKFIFEAANNKFVNANVEVYDMLGNKMLVMSINSTKTEIDLSGYAKGIYFYRILSSEKVFANGKLIVGE